MEGGTIETKSCVKLKTKERECYVSRKRDFPTKYENSFQGTTRTGTPTLQMPDHSKGRMFGVDLALLNQVSKGSSRLLRKILVNKMCLPKLQRGSKNKECSTMPAITVTSHLFPIYYKPPKFLALVLPYSMSE